MHLKARLLSQFKIGTLQEENEKYFSITTGNVKQIFCSIKNKTNAIPKKLSCKIKTSVVLGHHLTGESINLLI